LSTVVLKTPLRGLLARFVWFWPWIGEEYELWLVTAKGKRFLAWQGNGDNWFQHNLELLKQVTGATIERAPDDWSVDEELARHGL
jgi:hypothetical protein